MKRVMSIVLVVLVMMMALSAIVSAATGADVIAKLKAAGVPAQYISIAESYLAENEITSEQADAIIANIDKAIAIADGKSISELTGAQRSAIAAEITAAANEIGLSTVYNSETGLSIVDSTGRSLVTVSASSSELRQTGFNYSVVVAGIALVVLAAGSAVVIRKKSSQH